MFQCCRSINVLALLLILILLAVVPLCLLKIHLSPLGKHVADAPSVLQRHAHGYASSEHSAKPSEQNTINILDSDDEGITMSTVRFYQKAVSSLMYVRRTSSN